MDQEASESSSKPVLNVKTFQRLLAAAYLLQVHSDRTHHDQAQLEPTVAERTGVVRRWSDRSKSNSESSETTSTSLRGETIDARNHKYFANHPDSGRAACCLSGRRRSCFCRSSFRLIVFPSILFPSIPPYPGEAKLQGRRLAIQESGYGRLGTWLRRARRRCGEQSTPSQYLRSSWPLWACRSTGSGLLAVLCRGPPKCFPLRRRGRPQKSWLRLNNLRSASLASIARAHRSQCRRRRYRDPIPCTRCRLRRTSGEEAPERGNFARRYGGPLRIRRENVVRKFQENGTEGGN